MREDFFEVVIERPRTRPWRRKRRSPWHFLPELERPRCESMSRNRGGDKHLTDLLGPLRRFLRARVGRPFDDVMSEVRERIAPGHFLQQHILEHLDHMVGLRGGFRGRDGLYVDEAGILRRCSHRR